MNKKEMERPNVYLFNGCEIEFDLTEGKNVMVNATQMAKVFNKQVGHFLENDSTEKFINACLNNRNSDYLNVKTKEDLINSKQKSGTWMHRILALKFAAWLNADFEVWVFSTIDHILFEYAKIQEKSMFDTLNYQNEMKTILEKKEKTGADFTRYLELENLIKEAKGKRSKATKNKFSQMKSLFDQQ